MINKIGIIGNGSWGTALAKILTDNGEKIMWWLRNEEDIRFLKTRRHNRQYLTSVHFREDCLDLTNSLEQLMASCDTIVFCVPSAYAQQVLNQIPCESWERKNVISAIKGILPDSNLLLHEYLAKNCKLSFEQYVAITGPCHAEEVARECVAYLTFSGLNSALSGAVADKFANQYIHTKANHDIWGAQFAAVLKNIYAVGAGIAHGLGYGDNFLSVYITNCYREMYQFVKTLFAQIHPEAERPDFHTSAYLGDLLVTCYSLHSRNRSFGNMIGKGYTVQNAILEMKMVAEGYYASKGMQHITRNFGLQLPIAQTIYEILWEAKSAQQSFEHIELILS